MGFWVLRKGMGEYLDDACHNYLDLRREECNVGMARRYQYGIMDLSLLVPQPVQASEKCVYVVRIHCYQAVQRQGAKVKHNQ